jgi:hypothetical protein
MKTRTDLLNHLAEKHGLISYLEIGLQDSTQNFDKIICPHKVSVDPEPRAGATFQLLSDDFFKVWQSGDLNKQTWFPSKFDLIFIDGLHTADQVRKDFMNALSVLSECGCIVIHDCNPEKEEHTIVPRPTERGHWNGDVYKFAANVHKHSQCYTVDIDNGCMVFFRRELSPINLGREITWEKFNRERKELLNLISWDEFVAIGSHV